MPKTAEKSLTPHQALVDRFSRDLDSLIRPGERIGIAVSGGPDSLALLFLAAAARPGLVEAATVDHSLRVESRSEAETVAGICERLGVPHSTLTAEWNEKPETAIQERARKARYALLGAWAREKTLGALLTGHHADDQAETLVMRLLRGAGVKGLAGMRRFAKAPGTAVVENGLIDVGDEREHRIGDIGRSEAQPNPVRLNLRLEREESRTERRSLWEW